MSTGFISKTGALVAKDLRVELRGRDTLPPMVAFAFTVALLLAFAAPAPARLEQPVSLPFGTVAFIDVAAAFFWITTLFAGLIGFARTFEVERDDGAMDALLLAPLDRSGLFLAKATANLAFIAIVQVFLLPTFAVLFHFDLGTDWSTLVLIVGLVDVGFVALGTLFASVAAQTRSRELILPILALPAMVPLFIAAFELTSDLLAGDGLERVAARGWFAILVAFDVIFTVASALAFEFVIDA
ncbi:MAG TPA: heme exporter protein CcmB [Actinomycetota bacterium]|nr:heme exporter protein CcmB [Actinomycetota bacterium]